MFNSSRVKGAQPVFFTGLCTNINNVLLVMKNAQNCLTRMKSFTVQHSLITNGVKLAENHQNAIKVLCQ